MMCMMVMDDPRGDKGACPKTFKIILIQVSVSYGVIRIRKYAFNWFVTEPVYELKFDICHLHGLGAACHEHDFH